MGAAQLILGRLALGAAGAVGLYAVLLGLLVRPNIQRSLLYSHNFNTLYLSDLNEPESFGFAPNQVTPFLLQTPDNERLYAWHVLPADVYTQNEKAIRAEQHPHAAVADITQTLGFKLLTEKSGSPPPRVVVYFHGNAGHIGENWRPATYRYFASQPNTHVFALDYRGFGHSTGEPDEAGVIIDATTLVHWVLHVAGIPADRIVIVGQSLGTAISSAVALHFADPTSELIPAAARAVQPLLPHGPGGDASFPPTTFAGVVLAASFSSVPALLLTWRAAGLVPLLLPLRPFPWLADRLKATVQDTWLTSERLAAYYDVLQDNAQLLKSPDGRRALGSVQLLHALNDRDIPYHQTEMICRRMFRLRDAASEVRKEEIERPACIDGAKGPGVLDVAAPGRPRVRFEITEFGGHNKIITFSTVHAAVARALDGLL